LTSLDQILHTLKLLLTYTITYVNEEVNCRKPFPSDSIPWMDIVLTWKQSLMILIDLVKFYQFSTESKDTVHICKFLLNVVEHCCYDGKIFRRLSFQICSKRVVAGWKTENMGCWIQKGSCFNFAQFCFNKMTKFNEKFCYSLKPNTTVLNKTFKSNNFFSSDYVLYRFVSFMNKMYHPCLLLSSYNNARFWSTLILNWTKTPSVK
jgi:hypothetical protein